MAAFPFDALSAPVSDDQPCGPDLELEGDAEFMRFNAQIEGILPESFFSFDRKDAGLPGHLAAAGALLKRTADIRLLAAAAKLFILDRDFASFSACMSMLATWLAERWPDLHPGLLGDDPIMRIIALQSLDDNPHTVLPLQAAPLFKSRRLGFVSLRSYLLADGKVQPRAGMDGGDEPEKVPSTSDLQSALRDADLADLMAARGHSHALVAAIDAIETIVDEQTGQHGLLRFPQLKSVAGQLVALLDKAAAERDPTLAVAVAALDDDTQDGQAEPRPQGDASVSSAQDVAAALRAAAVYFETHEPSSPVRLLVAQSRALLGKSFYEALAAIAPEIVGQAAMRPARELTLSLPLDRLAQLLPPSPEEEASDESWGQADAVSEDAADGAFHDGENPDDAAEDDDASADRRAVTIPKRSAPIAGTRQEAMKLLENAADFLRASEPSSPVPFILDHARVINGRDFLALLRDLLPARALRVDDE